MTLHRGMVYVIDDDAAMREALSSLIRSVGLSVILFTSAGEFLAYTRPDTPSCLVLDVRPPGRSGLDLQRDLHLAGEHLPVIFITGHGDIPMRAPSSFCRSRSESRISSMRSPWP